MAEISEFIKFLRSRGPSLRAGAVEGLRQEKIPKLAAFIQDNPHGVTINSAFRSPQHQAEILRSHLAKKSPELVQKWDDTLALAGGDVVKAGEAARPWLREAGVTKWVAPPGASKHQRGEATDLGYANDAARQWALANAAKYGLNFPMPHEPWHVELAGVRGNMGDQTQGFGGLPTQSGVAATNTPMRMPDLTAPTTPATAPEAVDPSPSNFDLSKAIASFASALTPPAQTQKVAEKPQMPAIRQPQPRAQLAERVTDTPKRASLGAIFGT